MKLVNFLVLFFISIYCHGQDPQGNRILGWQVDLAENNNYDSAFNYALNGCMQTVSLAVAWASIEPNKGQFDQNIIQNILDIANIYYPAYKTKVELQIYTMNTVKKEIPKDLNNASFNDPKMIKRFKILLDTLFKHIPNIDLTVLNIGNESDGVMGINRSKYIEYKSFLNGVIPHAKMLYKDLHQKDLKIGTTFTYHGLTDINTRSLCQLVNKDLDVVSVTYYPLNTDFTMKDPSVVPDDFNHIVSIYPDKNQPLYFIECGYSSSAVCKSSEKKQAEFWDYIFNAWDDHIDNIAYLMIFKSTDWSREEVDFFGQYYGISDIKFLEYLRTLGVRTWNGNGENKKAYETILCELESRSWCNVSCKTTSNSVVSNHPDFQISPNPTSGKIHIKTIDKIKSIDISNISGYHFKSSQKTNIDLSSFPIGIYIIQIKFENGTILTKKIIIN